MSLFSYCASSSQLLSVQVREKGKYDWPEVESSGGQCTHGYELFHDRHHHKELGFILILAIRWLVNSFDVKLIFLLIITSYVNIYTFNYK